MVDGKWWMADGGQLKRKVSGQLLAVDGCDAMKMLQSLLIGVQFVARVVHLQRRSRKMENLSTANRNSEIFNRQSSTTVDQRRAQR